MDYVLHTIITIAAEETTTTTEQTSTVATTSTQITTTLPETTTQPKTTTSDTMTTVETTTTTFEPTTTTPIETTTSQPLTTTNELTTSTEPLTTTTQVTTTTLDSTTETTTHFTTPMETTTFISSTTDEPTTTLVETTTTESPELPVHCCCRCCYDVTSSPLTSSCTVCSDESLADASQCAAQPPPSPTPFTRPTEPNFEPPAQLEGSKFSERLAFNEEFLAKEQLTEKLASISLSEKIALGFSASEFILDCSYDGVPCSLDK